MKEKNSRITTAYLIIYHTYDKKEHISKNYWRHIRPTKSISMGFISLRRQNNNFIIGKGQKYLYSS